jgi:hypothetical protein
MVFSCQLMGTAHDFAAKAESCQLMHVMFHQKKLVWMLVLGFVV